MQSVLRKTAKRSIKAYLLTRPTTWLLLLGVLLLTSLIGIALFVALSLGGDSELDEDFYSPSTDGNAQITKEVLRWEPLIRKYAEKEGISDQVGLLLALVQQESGGRHLDVMQSSESLGLPRGALIDPEYSIQAGVKYFADVLKKSDGDIKIALQSYNFGAGFIPYAKENGGYSKEVAVAFSEMMAAKQGWESYGDVHYVDHVLRYVNGNGPTVSNGNQAFDVERVHNVMKNYLGFPYVWGGRKPAAGGFDCSGLLEYAFGLDGKPLNGTAQTQYDMTVPVSEEKIRPGDLVFFSTYKAGASHVGMYVGNGQFINANDNGVEYSSISEWKQLYPFLGYRRVL
jgi:cell wall-associated NlpC family hydrolase